MNEKWDEILRYFINDCSQVFDYIYLHLAINTEVCTWQLALWLCTVKGGHCHITLNTLGNIL